MSGIDVDWGRCLWRVRNCFVAFRKSKIG